MEVKCSVIDEDELSLSGKLQRKSGFKSLAENAVPPQMTCRYVGVSGKQMLLVKVMNNQSENMTISQIKVALSDPHQASIDLDHPETYHEDRDTFEIDSMEDLDEDNYGNLKIEGPKTGFPASLKPLESYAALFKIHVKDSLEYNYTMEVDLQGTLIWSLGSSSHQYFTNYSLICLRIRKPGMVITANTDTQPTCKGSFIVKYTITNYLQDFLSIKLLWIPEKALKDPKVLAKAKHQQAVERVIKSVICQQPTTHLGALKMGSTLSVNIPFQVLDPGLFELGQHMKLNLQYSLGNASHPNETNLSAGSKPHILQRRGSNTSTQSMPLESQVMEVSQRGHGSKSASMSPVTGNLVPGLAIGALQGHPLARADNKKGSSGSLHGQASTLASPSRGFPRGAVTPSPTLARPRLGILGTRTSSLSRTPSNASIASLSKPGTLTALQVLKRNCQIYVQPVIAN